MEIDILLSTFNSEKYLPVLLDSLFKQTYNEFRIIIRDDCSTDKTPILLQYFESKNPERITIINNLGRNLGAKNSFAELLKYSSANYIMFCDHDDFWLPNKVEVTRKKMREMENAHLNSPILVFSDLIVADENLHIISFSLWKYWRINPTNSQNIYKLAINNPVVGCTVMINKYAKLLSIPIHEKAIMHDWWIALKVANQGFIDFIKEPTILYRQHEKNTIGVTKTNFVYLLRRFFKIKTLINENRNAFNMLKLLNVNVSMLKFLYFKFTLTYKKILP
jgi:glycosyltransferase involved in cell wall biosynthesis